MLGLLLSWIGISLIGAALIAGAVVAMWLGFRTIALILVAAAAAHIYSGVIYQQGVWACEQRVKAAVAAERVRQKTEANLAIAALEQDLDAAETAEAAAERALAELEAARATLPVAQLCILDTQEKVDAINGR